jgi:hypothetical protein
VDIPHALSAVAMLESVIRHLSETFTTDEALRSGYRESDLPQLGPRHMGGATHGVLYDC